MPDWDDELNEAQERIREARVQKLTEKKKDKSLKDLRKLEEDLVINLPVYEDKVIAVPFHNKKLTRFKKTPLGFFAKEFFKPGQDVQITAKKGYVHIERIKRQTSK